MQLRVIIMGLFGTITELKQVILIRTDLKLPKGKAAAQAAHASVEAVLNSDRGIVERWRSMGMKKIVLKVADEKELLMYQQLAKKKGLVASVITDAGRTVVEPGTRTCVGIGPAAEEVIDSVTKDLGMY
jgi:PTH2 family peptidyl-tRNA hydrolase